jgi:hypothetical protein
MVHLADEHQRREAIPEGVERLERRDGVLAADEELALELVPVARRVVEAEMGEAVQPGSGDAQLLGARVRGDAGHPSRVRLHDP